MRPEQAVDLLSGEWPPKNVLHWPPKDPGALRKGMSLVGRIEAIMTLPRPDGSKHRGEPYTALYVRREGDGRLVMFHGWHTAAEDLGSMHPAPGLLFACVYRGEEDNGFKNFKFLVTPYDPPTAPQARSGDGGPAEPPSQAPEGEAPSPTPPSGSTATVVPLDRLRSTTLARAYVKSQPAAWQELFRQVTAKANATGELRRLSELDGYKQMIGRTAYRWQQQRGETA